MGFRLGKFLVICLILLGSCGVFAKSDLSEAEEYIAQARQFDGLYNIGEDVSQQKALECYRNALDSNPDDQQKLQILNRMAELNSCCFNSSIGEGPDYSKAIECYRQIIEEYPMEEPLVLKAYSGLCDNYTISKDFEQALVFAKKTLTLDVSSLEAELSSLEKQRKDWDARYSPSADGEWQRVSSDYSAEDSQKFRENIVRIKLLKKSIELIKRQQKVGVDQVNYTAERMGVMRAHGELKNLMSQYAGTFIGDYAAKKFTENMDKMPDLWAPQFEGGGPIDSRGNDGLVAGSANPVVQNNFDKDIVNQVQSSADENKADGKNIYVDSSYPKAERHFIKEERASPWKLLILCSVLAGIILLIIIIFKLIKKGK